MCPWAERVDDWCSTAGLKLVVIGIIVAASTYALVFAK